MTRFKVFFIRPSEEETLNSAREIAESVLSRINEGENFDMLVREFSQGPNTDKGGDMGYMPAGSTIPEIEDAISALSAGEVSGVIEAGSGFYIVKVLDKKQAGAVPIMEVSDLIKERLFQRESELTLREFVSKLKEDAYIKIN
jgi:parvulin-like peptidyl-prolyl isomerase